MHALRRTAVAVMSTLAVVATSLAVSPIAHAVDLGSDVVISEVYGGGGNSGAPFRNDFIELYNKGAAAVSVEGWSVQYASASGTSWSSPTPLTGAVPAGGYYLIAEAAGANTAAPPLPTPNASGTLAMSGTGGKVALVKNGTAPLGCAAACSTAANVVDFVGYGAANDSAGGHPTPTLSNTTSAQRTVTPFTNTGDNLADFTTGAPTPNAAGTTPAPGTNCSAAPTPAECVPGTTTIQDIQGNGFLSPLKGTAVSRVAGTVTAVRTSGTRGFWIQQPSPDATRASASSAVFVYSSKVVPTVGDAVLVTGSVSDYYPLSRGETVATTANLSLTEIVPTTVTTVSKGNPIPAALVLTPTTVPDTYAPSAPGGNIESIQTVNPAGSALEFWEAHEGMLVEVSDARVVGPGQPQYGEIYVTTKPTELATPRGGTYLASYAKTPTGRLLVSPLDGKVPAANVGDQLMGATRGPVDWSTFGGYGIAATQLGTYRDNHLTPTTAKAQAADQLAVGTYNVENLAPGDAATKYERLGAGVVTNLKSPDVISVEEIQDNSGSENNGVVAADQTLGKLVAAITAAGGPAYRWAAIDPVNNQDGGQPGGNIRSVFLYNPARVTLAPKAAGDSTTAVTVDAGADGTAQLSVNPGRVDPTNEAWTASRKPLAGEFTFHGRKVIVVANHFNSKGGDQSANGRFQPPNRTSEVQRTKQATVLNGFVKQVLAADRDASIVLAGDFNDYQFSAPMKALTDDGATLTDLINTLPENERYTYIFNGVSQVLDHILVSKAVKDVEYDVVHLNSEFSAQSSDHDPQVARIRLGTRQGALALNPSTTVVGRPVQVQLTGWYPNRSFTVSLDSTVAGTVTTDANGVATFTLPVPAGTSTGVHTVSATTASDGATASASLTVKPVPVQQGTVKLAPPQVKAGKSVLVKLDGWAAGATLAISLDGGATLASATTDESGHANVHVAIPAGTTPGNHRIVVTATDERSVSAALEVR